jgi:hypothetical protein
MPAKFKKKRFDYSIMCNFYPHKRKRTCPEIFRLNTNKGGPSSLDLLITLQIDACKMYYLLIFNNITHTIKFQHFGFSFTPHISYCNVLRDGVFGYQ